MERLCHIQRGGEHRRIRPKGKGREGGTERERERGEARNREREEMNENQARLGGKKKNGKESALSPERPTAEETAQKRNLDTLASRRKLTTTGVVEVSINIC